MKKKQTILWIFSFHMTGILGQMKKILSQEAVSYGKSADYSLCRIAQKDLAKIHGYRLLQYRQDAFTIATSAQHYEQLCEAVTSLAAENGTACMAPCRPDDGWCFWRNKGVAVKVPVHAPDSRNKTDRRRRAEASVFLYQHLHHATAFGNHGSAGEAADAHLH